MFRKLISFIFSFLISVFLWGQSETNSDNYLQWGTIKLPINELVNGSNGRIKVSLNEVLKSANQPIILIKNGKDARLKSFYFIITKNNLSSSPTFVHVENYDKKNALNIHGKAFVEKNLKEGQNIYFNNLKGEDGEEHFLSLEIEYEIPPLKVNFKLPNIPTGEVFGFQIQEFPNQRLKIKMDTVDVAMEKIFNTYKKYEKYDIIHIPNYKTTRRYLTPKDVLNIKCKEAFNLVENQEVKNIDLEMIPEFTEYDGYDINIKWGEMTASNLRNSFSATGNDGYIETSKGEIVTFQDYDKYDLSDAIGGRFTLSQGFQSYKIKRMKVYVIPKNKPPTSYITDEIGHSQLKKVFAEIEKDTMILFSEIVIEKDANVLLYFPTSLLFGIR